MLQTLSTNIAERYYLVAHSLSDPATDLWQEECTRRGWPCIVLRELKNGQACVSVRAHATRPFSAYVNERIAYRAQGLLFKDVRLPRSRTRGYWYLASSTHIMTFKSIPLARAIQFTETIAGILSCAGYFPAILEAI